MAPRRKKQDESESAEDYSEEDDYELPADAYYDKKGCAPLGSGGAKSQRGRAKRMDLEKEEDRINKMLEEQSEDEESEADQPDDEEEAEQKSSEKKTKGRATGKDLVPCEVHPLDHTIESIIADRIKKPTPKASAKKAQIEDKSHKQMGSTEETKEGSSEKPEDATMNDETVSKKEAKSGSQSQNNDDGEEESSADEVCEEFLVKLKGLCYLETKWLTERDFRQYSFQCQQKLKRYLVKREKLASGLQAPTNDQNLNPGDYYDPHYAIPDKVLTSTNLFPVIHPRQAKNVIGSWRERCILVLQHIMSYRGEEGHYYSTPFIFLRTDERAVMDFTTINNRLHTIPSSSMQQQAQQNPQKTNSFYQGPADFWADLGQVFIEGLSNYHVQTKEWFFLRRMRELAYYFYLGWRRQIAHIKDEKIKNPPKPEKKPPLQQIQQLLAKKSQLDLSIKQAKIQFQAAPNLQNQQHLAQLVPQSNMILQTLEQLAQHFQTADGQQTPDDLQDSAEKTEAYKQVCETLPKFIQTLKLEMQPSSQQQPQSGNTSLVGGESSSYRTLLIQSLNQIVPPLDVDQDNKPIDKQKEAEAAAKPGSLVLGVKLLIDLGTCEEKVLATPEDFAWLLKKNETIQMILEDEKFDAEVIFAMLMGGVDKIDPIYYVKWQNLSYTDCTWEAASLIRKQDETDSKIKDFERFNRSLDNNSRQKMMGFGYAHKQILKIYSKKLEKGRKIDHRSAEELQTREMLSKLLKFEGMTQSKGYFQYNFEQNLVPQFRLGQKCKAYQIAGLNWMLRAFQDNRNIVLADEMGLGKTVQTISLLDHLIKICKIRGPFLVIAPLSTLEHWKNVAEQWTYMNVVVYHDRGGAEGRNRIKEQDWYYTDVTNKGTITQKSKLIKFNLMITSYEVFNADLQDVLKDVPFQFVIVDEAHRLKNKQAKTLNLLKEHPCRRILLLTGTPVQNNTKELFVLLNYLEPEAFSNFDKFMAQFGDLKSAEQVENLHRILKPHFLRRLKDEVEDSIPPLKETVVEVSLTQQQQQYYRGIYGENLAMLASLSNSGVKTFNFNNIDMQLRKCCNHLYLLKGVEDDLTRKCRTEADLTRSMLDSSGKLQLLDKFIDKYRDENHKMLVFSQFKGMIDLIREFLTLKKIRSEVLTGNVKSQDRVTAIQRFNEDNEFGVFLLTTRAGGLGINLTKARVVVIFDSDWNPQNDLQAIARAHRIGQKFEVEVYRFITAKTYEQQMFDRASKKLGMEQALFQKGAFHDQAGEEGADGVAKINPEEVEKLLKYGAYAFLGEDEIEDGEGEGDDDRGVKIEDILKNKGGKSSKKGSGGGGSKATYTLQKTTFTVADMNKGKSGGSGRSSVTKGAAGGASGEKKQKLDVNDPNFWEKVLPFDGYNPKQLNRKLRSKKNDILKSKETQSKFLKDVSKCVDDCLDAKSTNPSLEIDEELYDLLKRINKMKQFEHKYRTKSTVLLDKLLHFNDYRIMDGDGDGARLQRKAKQKPKDYKEKTTINGKRRKKANSKASGSQPADEEDDEDDEESQSDSEGEQQQAEEDGGESAKPEGASQERKSPKDNRTQKKQSKKTEKVRGATVKMRGHGRVSSLDELESSTLKEARDSLAGSDKSKNKSDKKKGSKRQRLS